MFKKSDLKGFVDLIKETNKNNAGFEGFLQGLKEIGSINIKSTDIVKDSERLNDLVTKFNNRGTDFNLDTFLSSIDDTDIKDKFKSIAESANDATASLEDLFAVKIKDTHGLKNVKGLINEFNNLDTNKQKDFANAIGQSNSRLGDYLKNLEEGNASLGDYIKSLLGATAKETLLQIATSALNAAIASVATLLINAMVQSITETINAYDNAIKKVEEYKNSIESIDENLDTLNKDLSENVKKLRELEQIDNPTLYEQDQIDGLKEVNAELTRQIKLKEYELELKEKEYRLEAQRAYKNTQFDKTWFNDAFDEKENASWIDHVLGVATAGGWWNVRNAVSNTSNAFQGNLFSQNEKDLEEYKRLIEEYEVIQQAYADGTWEYGEEQYKDTIALHEKLIGELEIQLSSFRNDQDMTLLALDPDADKEAIAQIEGFISTYDDLYNRMNNPNYKNFTSVYENAEFADITAELKALAESGELTEETFGNVVGIKKFTDALEDAGIDTEDVEEIIRAIESAVADNSDTVVDDGIPAITDLTTAYSALSEALDEIYSKQDKLSDTFSKVISGAKLTRDEILELVDTFPELVDYISNSGDGYTISVEGLRLANNNLNADAKAQAQNVIDAYVDAQKRLNNLKTTPIGNNYEAQQNASEIAEVQKYLSEAKDEYASALLKLGLFDKGFDEHQMTLDSIDEKYNTAKSSIDNYNNSIKTVDSAITKLNEGQALTHDEMIALVEISPKLSDSIEERSNGYYIEVDALKDLRFESKEARNQFIDDQIEMAKEAISAAEVIVAAHSLINSATDWENNKKILQEQWEIIRGYREDIAIWEQEKKEYIDDSSSTSGSSTDDPIVTAFEKQLKYLDYLKSMGMISEKEYYKQLYYLNEKYYSDNADYLEQYRDNEIKIRDGITDIEIREIDRQIEAIELLKEKREEEKELQALQVELEEKKLELLNKQSQKNVRYYDANKREWIWTYNRNDVADAQKAVDEAQEALDEHLYQSNEDKKIEQLEQIKEILQGDEDNPNNAVQFVGSEGVTTQATGRKVTLDDFLKYLGVTQPVDTTAFLNAIYSTGLQPNVEKIAESTHNQNYENIRNSNTNNNTFNVTVNASGLSKEEATDAVYDAISDLMTQVDMRIK